MATVPQAPASATATGVLGGSVTVSWTPPASDGGSPIYRYVVKRKGFSTPVVQINDPAARSYVWTTTWAEGDIFQVRAVNSVGFGAWCEAPVTIGTVTPPPPPPSDSWLKRYTDDAYWTSVPGPVDLSATTAMRNFLNSSPDQTDAYPLLKGVGGNQWGMVYREGNASDPVWKLTGNVPADVAFLKSDGFHAPADLADSITGTSDSPMVVVDWGAGFTMWASKVSKGAGNTINVLGAAGAFWHGSNGLDKRRPESDSVLNFRSRGAIPDAMVIPKDRLDWAVANNTDLGYVLHVFWVETKTNADRSAKLPMVGDEAGKNGWGSEGQRISIDPSIDLTTRGLSPYGLAIARTLQRHGGYLGDNAGSGTSLKLEQDQTAHPVWGTSITADELQGLTWNDFVANVS